MFAKKQLSLLQTILCYKRFVESITRKFKPTYFCLTVSKHVTKLDLPSTKMATLCYIKVQTTTENKALLPNVPQCLILVVNALRVLLACCKNFNLILLFHKKNVKTKPGYKADLKDVKSFK